MTALKTTTSISGICLMGAAALLLAACTSNMEPAHQAIANVSSALDANGDDAKRYVPEKYNEALAKLNAMKVAFNHQDYRDVIKGEAARGLKAAAVAGKDEYMKLAASEWASLSALVPKLLGVVEVRGQAIERAKKRPEGLDLETARRTIVDARKMWTQAQAAADHGRVDTAVDSAKLAKRRCEQAAKALKIELPSG
jgi:hypothetical protein